MSTKEREGTFDYQKLIIAVRNEDILWNVRNPNYRNSLVRNAKWKDIARIVKGDEIEANECQLEWKRLREKYIREKKIQQEGSRSGSAGGFKRKWEFLEDLSFLDSVYKKRRTFSSIGKPYVAVSSPQPENTEDIEDIFEIHTGCEEYLNAEKSRLEDSTISNNISELVDIAKTLNASSNQQTSGYRQFGDYIVKVMDELKDEEAKVLEKKILLAVLEVRHP